MTMDLDKMMKLRTKLLARLRVLEKQRDDAIVRAADKAAEAVSEIAGEHPEEWALLLQEDATVAEHIRALAPELVP